VAITYDGAPGYCSVFGSNMTTLIAFIICAFIGAFIGFFTCSLLSINREDDHGGSSVPSDGPGERLIEADAEKQAPEKRKARQVRKVA
jgi:hypothetical protein